MVSSSFAMVRGCAAVKIRKRQRKSDAELAFEEAQKREAARYAPVRIGVAGARWFVAHVMAGCERRVAADLVDLGFRAYCPLSATLSHRARVKGSSGRVRRVRIAPVFAAYLFVGVLPGREIGKSAHEKIIEILGDADERGEHRALEIPGALVAMINERELAREWDRAHRPVAPFRVGSEVRMKEGPFAGFSGFVAAAPVDMRVRIEAMLFGRATRLTVEARQLEPVAL